MSITSLQSHFQKLSLKSEKLEINKVITHVEAEKMSVYNSSVKVTSASIAELIESHIPEFDSEDVPFFILNVAKVVEKFDQWMKLLPRVEPHYAVKCNPDPVIIKTLAALGAKFDCASQGEINQVLSVPNVAPEDIIFANPCKPKGHLNFAKSRGVKQMTFDNLQELQKIRECFPEAELLLRFVVDDSGALCQFSSKFGCPLNDCERLLKCAKDMGLNVVGVSFHVGSGQQTVEAYADALDRARLIFDMAENVGYRLAIVDIGGGFPGDDIENPEECAVDFSQIAATIAKKIDELFPNTRCIAEPGRYFAAACCTLVTKVTSVRDQTSSEYESSSDYLYYINDGVYGSFNNLLFDHATCFPTFLTPKSGNVFRSTIFGPSCDGLDCILKNYPLPKIEIGEWVYWKNMGAYTMCAAASFNGFPLPETRYVYCTKS